MPRAHRTQWARTSVQPRVAKSGFHITLMLFMHMLISSKVMVQLRFPCPRSPSPTASRRDATADARMVSTSVPAGFREGDLVDVFYRISQDSGHYFPVANAASGTLRPRYGRTDGWMRAVLAEDWPLGQAAQVGDLGATGSVKVRHTHPFWVNPAGELLDVSNERNMVVTVDARDVRPASDGRLTARPTLSIFVVRWGGEHTKFNNEEWGGAGASVSEQYIEWFLDKCVYATLGPDYEVSTRRREAARPRGRHAAATAGCRPLRGARPWP